MRLTVLLFSLLLASPAFAHGGHDDAPGETAAPATSGSIKLSDTVIKNLGIQTSPATLAPIGKAVELNASVEYLPESYANVAARANGSVTKLMIQLGDTVKKGQPIAVFQPVFIGNEPVTLYAPIAGDIVKLNAVIGQALTPETPVAAVVDTSKVLVKGIAYASTDIGALKIGQKIRFTAIGQDKPFEGEIQRLSRSLEAESRTYAIYAIVDNPDHALLENTAGTMSVVLGEETEALTIPSKAVLGELGDYFIFVREGDSFERRAVALGQKYGDMVEILDGVLPDEDVVTVGNYQLQYAKPATGSAPTKDAH